MKPKILVVGDIGDVLHSALKSAADPKIETNFSAAQKSLGDYQAVVVGLTKANGDAVKALLHAAQDKCEELPVALAAPRAELTVLSEYYLNFPQIAPLVETEGLREKAATRHVELLVQRVSQAETVFREDDLIFGTYFSKPRSAAEYRAQRSLSLISPSMQGFLDDLRDAVTAMRRTVASSGDAGPDELVMPPIPWDPHERSPGMKDPQTWTTKAKHLPNLRDVLDNANHANAQRLLRNDGKDASKRAIAAFDKPPHLMLEGDSGTGKTMVATLIRDLFRQQAGSAYGDAVEMPFEAINCGGMTIDNFDHRMYGSASGIFTDARNVGQLVRAAYGVAFFDELGDLSYEAQTRLLVYLEDGYLTPEGTAPFPGFTRVVAATNRRLEQLIREHRFRHDLLARFSKRVRLPSLAERGEEDLERLIDFVALNPAVNSASGARHVERMSSGALKKLKQHSYADGNFRELESIVHRAIEQARRQRRRRVEADDIVLTDPVYEP